MQVTNDIYYVGVNDHKKDLFEGQFIIPEGMAYNSYIIEDEKIAIMDTADAEFEKEWLENVQEVLKEKTPDYLVIHHMECDHSSIIGKLVSLYPDITLVATAPAFNMLKNMFTFETEVKQIAIKDGDTLSLGKHTLHFYTAPFVHWPEVMMSYDEEDKVLFSADAFGKFGANDVEEDDWACEARRYYFGIVGKYGQQVQNLLHKLEGLDIQIICPLHGPVLNENISYYVNIYNTWSSYTPEDSGVVIVYTSVYGHTKQAAELLKQMLEEKGAPSVSIFDAVRDDFAEIVEDVFRYDRLVLATTTYNGEIFPNMKFLIDALVERNYQNRKVALIENGTWGPAAKKVMTNMLANQKDVQILEEAVTIKTCLNEESHRQLEILADALCK